MLELLTVLLVVLLLVTLNGLFVAAEFAIISAPRGAVAARAQDGDRRAARTLATLDSPARLDRYVATAQLGITFASLGLGMYGEHTLAMLLEAWLHAQGFEGLGARLSAHGVAVILAITAITYLHIVFGEMIPKALALTRALPAVLWLSPFMLAVGLLLHPLVLALNHTGNFLLRLAGTRRDISSQHYLAPEELETLARESQESGLLSEEAGRIFREIADFSQLNAGQAMVPRVHIQGLPVNAGNAELRAILQRHHHTRYPVYRENLDHIVGTVHIKDLLQLLLNGSGLLPTVIRDTAYLPQTAGLDDVLAAMERTRTQMLVIMDEHGGTAGLLTIEDICVEAVGEVEEGADAGAEVRPMGRNSFLVQGATRLGMLGALIERKLEHPDVDTISGLILNELRRPPRIGDRAHWQGLSFEVRSLHGHGVRQALVRLTTDRSSSTDDNGADG